MSTLLFVPRRKHLHHLFPTNLVWVFWLGFFVVFFFFFLCFFFLFFLCFSSFFFLWWVFLFGWLCGFFFLGFFVWGCCVCGFCVFFFLFFGFGDPAMNPSLPRHNCRINGVPLFEHPAAWPLYFTPLSISPPPPLLLRFPNRVVLFFD